jgi:hypothetical protein
LELSSSVVFEDEDEGFATFPTAVWFEGLKPGVQGLTLNIWGHGQDVTFEIALEDYQALRVRYSDIINRYISPRYNYSVSVENAVFSSAMSSIIYVIEGQEGLVHGGAAATSPNQFISLRNNDRLVFSKDEQPKLYNAGNAVVGVMNFEPAFTLDRDTEIIFKNLRSQTSLNRVINAAGLFLNTPETEISIDLGAHSLVLERMRKFSSFFVLVHHFEYKANGERVMGELDISAHIIANERDIPLREPEINSGPRGTDVLFRFDDSNEAVKNSAPGDVYLNLQNALVYLPDVTMKLRLRDFTFARERSNYYNVVRAVNEAFELRFNSGNNAAQISSHFSRSVINDAALSSFYRPVNSAKYAVVTDHAARVSDDLYVAFVKESFIHEDGNMKEQTFIYHVVTVRQNGNNYVV